METSTISPPSTPAAASDAPAPPASAAAPASASAAAAVPAAAPAAAPVATAAPAAAEPSAPAPGAGPAKGTGPAGATTVDGVDIKGVISGSTSEVPLAELSKKGFKQVKVLNQAVIIKLIGEAVDQVMKKRSQKMSAEERTKVIQESTSKFEALSQEKIQRERNRISELEKANEALLRETEELRTQIDRFRAAPPPAPAPVFDHQGLMEAMVSRLQGMAGPGASVDNLQKSMSMIMDRLDKLPRGQGAEYVDKDIIIDALFRHDIEGAESNIDRVKVKEEKAGGVKDTLAKLKALQKKE